MAVFTLNPETFTAVTAGLWRAQGGNVHFAESSNPAPGDVMTLLNGEFLVLQSDKFARGTGSVVVFEP